MNVLISFNNIRESKITMDIQYVITISILFCRMLTPKPSLYFFDYALKTGTAEALAAVPAPTALILYVDPLDSGQGGVCH